MTRVRLARSRLSIVATCLGAVLSSCADVVAGECCVEAGAGVAGGNAGGSPDTPEDPVARGGAGGGAARGKGGRAGAGSPGSGAGEVTTGPGGTAGAENGGESGEGGRAGEDARGGESGASGDATCNDGLPSTFDFYEESLGCGHRVDSNPDDGVSWIHFDAGFEVDPVSGYGWRVIGHVSRESAIELCARDATAGRRDWHLPSIDEVRTLALGCPASLPGGSCPVAEPGCLTLACVYENPVGCRGYEIGAGPGLRGNYCNPDSTLCTRLHTTSRCLDCSDELEWIFSPPEGDIGAFRTSEDLLAACVSTTFGIGRFGK